MDSKEREFRIGARTYRSLQLGRDVWRISNPATGHVYGEIVAIPADGRIKAYWLAGAERERADSWAEAVQATRAQNPDKNMPGPAAAPAVAPLAPVVKPAPAMALPPEPLAPDTTGWLTSDQAVIAYGLKQTELYRLIAAGTIRAIRNPRGQRRGGGLPWLIAPPVVADPDPVVIDPPVVDTTGWLPLEQAGRAYGVTRSTLRRRIDGGTLPAQRIPFPNQAGYQLLVPPPPVALPEPTPVKQAAAEVATPEPKITIRPAGTKIAELEARIVTLEAGSKRRSWWDRLFGGSDVKWLFRLFTRRAHRIDTTHDWRPTHGPLYGLPDVQARRMEDRK